MPKSDLDVHLQSRISEFVEEVGSLVREAALEAVRAALTNGAPTRRSSPGKARKKATKKPGRRVRRTGAQVDALASKAHTAITRKPGRRLGEIAKELRVATKEARRPVQNLLDEKKVKTTGQRGGTRYFPASAARKRKSKGRAAA